MVNNMTKKMVNDIRWIKLRNKKVIIKKKLLKKKQPKIHSNIIKHREKNNSNQLEYNWFSSLNPTTWIVQYNKKQAMKN
jgi:hypothetical protein